MGTVQAVTPSLGQFPDSDPRWGPQGSVERRRSRPTSRSEAGHTKAPRAQRGAHARPSARAVPSANHQGANAGGEAALSSLPPFRSELPHPSDYLGRRKKKKKSNHLGRPTEPHHGTCSRVITVSGICFERGCPSSIYGPKKVHECRRRELSMGCCLPLVQSAWGLSGCLATRQTKMVTG